MSVHDTTAIVIVLFVLGILGILGFIFADALFGPFQTQEGVPATFKNDMKNLFHLFDSGIGIGIAILLIGSIFLASTARSHPFYAILAIFIQGFLIVVGYAFTAFFSKFKEAEAIASVLPSFPITNLVLSNLTMVAFFISLAIIVALYIKPSDAYAQQY